nr:MAG TPA: hypothetical protein [Caudoviricetes sp.]
MLVCLLFSIDPLSFWGYNGHTGRNGKHDNR